ncbi:MAG: PD-(D/E)XK nuclease-like domain-containing protein [Tannerellaceae bacterium]|jgi:hypothetical protein|nr:PD-(D/E)XK nuclease-like domain-containing protein [Tannerellaceae bacterium]
MFENLQLTEQEIEGLDFSALQTLHAAEKLNNGIVQDYAKGEYPPLDSMLSFIRANKDAEPVEIDIEALSVNGTCVKDEMSEYLNTRRISSGNLKEALKTPLSFLFDYEQRFEQEDKECFQIGTFCHLAFLEPELFDRVVVAPSINLVTKDGIIELINFYQTLNGETKSIFGAEWKMQDLKERLAELKAACKYKIIKPEQKVIIDTLKFHYNTYGGGILRKLFKGAVSEVSVYGNCPETGLELKCRPDALNVAENIGVNAIISLKTTRAESIGKFIYDAAKFKYEVSEGHYQQLISHVTGRKFNATIMVILQTVPPYQPAVLWWTPDSIEVGKYKANIAKSIIKECYEKKMFPGFDAKAPAGNCGIYEFELPQWAMKEEHPTAIDDDNE